VDPVISSLPNHWWHHRGPGTWLPISGSILHSVSNAQSVGDDQMKNDQMTRFEEQ
jgi:hypothetical protein